MKIKAIHIFLILCFSFLVFTLSIYLKPISGIPASALEIKKATQGKLVWQKYNCQVCHQLYGLGGYLGPDLTNVMSHPKKGEVLVRAIVKSGVKQMPAFDLADEELDELIAFLHSVDKTGLADPRTFTVTGSGMINLPQNK